MWIININDPISRTAALGKADGLEVDFFVRTNEGFAQHIQVSQTVKDAATLKMELAPFEKITEHHEKMLISMDYETGS